MTTIRLEAVPNQWGILRSITGTPALEGQGQRIVYSARVRRADRGRTRLSSGEMLESLEGDVTLYRGRMQMDDGQPYSDTMEYVAADPGTWGVAPSAAGYSVSLFLEERLFDQVVSLSRTCRLPRLDLDFDAVRGAAITFGGAPDGSDQVWNNKDHSVAHIVGAAIVIPLADYVETVDDQEPTPLDPELASPTMAQLDRRFAESNQSLTQLRNAVSTLSWAMIAIAGILVLTRLF